MPQIITLPTVTDERGKLTIVEKILPFEIKRNFFMYDIKKGVVRGGHRHKVTWQALVCVKGSCVIKTNNGIKKESVTLASPDKCLILTPEDWHTMEEFTPDAVLLVMSSDYYDANDYIDEDY